MGGTPEPGIDAAVRTLDELAPAQVELGAPDAVHPFESLEDVARMTVGRRGPQAGAHGTYPVVAPPRP